MSLSTFAQVLEFAHDANRYVREWYGMDESSAADVVQDVLLRLLQNGPEHLDNPKRYLKRACRWRALQIHRGRRRRDAAHAVVENRREKAERKSPEILVALEDEDKPKFFGQATPKQHEVLDLMLEGKSMTEVSAILEIPESTVRMRVHLVRKRLGGAA